uniref:uncharacterized protein LOC131109832 n=1 Tax=Doryrhamphus excisus TaxID=161450 RepID=UPI0025AE4E72|nr:uncharacterized protein LOC131109832 [Doryrhamphus excisus]
MRPPSHHIPPKSDKPQPPNGVAPVATEQNSKPTGLGAVAKLKAFMSAMLPSADRTPGRPPAIHPPWNKARIEPSEDAGKVLDRDVARQEETKRWRTRGEMETNLVRTNMMRNGLVSNGGPHMDRNILQGVPLKQKPNRTYGVIPLAGMHQGPARLGGQVWGDREVGRKMYGSIGDMSISALVSGRHGLGRQFRGDGGSSQGCRTKFHERHYSESRDSDSTIPSSSSMSTEREETESDTETPSMSQDGSVSGRESASESDDVWERCRRTSKRHGKGKDSKTKTYHDKNKGSPPQTDDLSPIVEDTDEDNCHMTEQDEEDV